MLRKFFSVTKRALRQVSTDGNHCDMTARRSLLLGIPYGIVNFIFSWRKRSFSCSRFVLYCGSDEFIVFRERTYIHAIFPGK